MKSMLLLSVGLIVGSSAFQVGMLQQAPQTHVGDKSIACNTASTGTTGGFTTWFEDDVYACANWNHKAKSQTGCFVALNGICGMTETKYCDKCVQIVNAKGVTEKCRVIDFCDPSNCDFYDAGHLDILNNNNNSHYNFTDQGVYVTPIPKQGPQPKVSWKWTTC